ncbi:cytochrome c oxidase assembly protein [Nesterenkonia lutea]|uniref:Membrane protein n=1 Tax=Nesterenkonia lutea TaxID=272919 RepID=A0ABR9JEQ4_9MICC|nr:cytochrome c oxidase assembly protein [Nesterenkonia lutea]MBE1523977.1 putative membrane protein [Nesterenkonia lutea]
MDHREGHHHTGEGALPAEEMLGWAVFDVVVLLVLLAGALGYVLALWAARERSPWARHRTFFWHLGLACAAAGLLGPVATAAHSSFTAHMLGHLLLGMLAPLLLVLGAPVTLALRALPPAAARRLSRVLRSPVVRVLTHPVIAAAVNAGGLWLLYTTELYPLMHSSAVVHALVHGHILLTGYIFTASIIGVDPDPHRASMKLRSVMLILFIAAHSILAKWLYAHPPQGVEVGDGQSGAQLMYYGGDAVDIVLIVLLFAGWYSATRPRGLDAAGVRGR